MNDESELNKKGWDVNYHGDQDELSGFIVYLYDLRKKQKFSV